MDYKKKYYKYKLKYLKLKLDGGYIKLMKNMSKDINYSRNQPPLPNIDNFLRKKIDKLMIEYENNKSNEEIIEKINENIENTIKQVTELKPKLKKYENELKEKLDSLTQKTNDVDQTKLNKFRKTVEKLKETVKTLKNIEALEEDIYNFRIELDDGEN